MLILAAQTPAPVLVYITRIEQFNAAHRIFNPLWSDEKNFQIFGKCSNPNGHGHNYELHVTFKGEINPETGFVVNFDDIKALIRKYVSDELDHKNLNLDDTFMKGIIPSAENIAIQIWKQLQLHLPESISLHKLTLYETPRNFVEYFGT